MSWISLDVPAPYTAVESRVRFAFGLLALAHGHVVVAPSAADHRFFYGSAHLPATPSWRGLEQPAPLPTTWNGLPVHHPETPDGPDLLAEIFEWASLAHEGATSARDEAGRIPSSDTLAIRAGLSPTVPWGSRLIDALHDRLNERTGLTSTAAPLGGQRILIGASHDVDFLPTSPVDTARRLAVWAAASARRFGAPTMAARILTIGAARALRGDLRHGIVDVARREQEQGIRSTFTWLTRHEHHRDARYDIRHPELGALLRALSSLGVEHALHGSYTSLEGPGRLAEEYDTLRRVVGPVVGGRQHWLRYDSPATLVHSLEESGAHYDATAGFSDRIGFRTGIAHPHPLYDLAEDRVSGVVEIPTPIMDVAVADRSTTDEGWRAECDAVLDAVDRHRLGGVSLLWHDPVLQGFQLPSGFEALYWKLHAPERHQWVPLGEIEASVRPRLEACGLSGDMASTTSRSTHPSRAATG